PADEAPTATADHVITNIGDNTQFQIPDSALIANDTDPDNPQSQLTIAAVNDNSGADSSLGDGVVNFKDTHAGDNSFDYTLSDGSLTATGHVTVSQDATARWMERMRPTSLLASLVGLYSSGRRHTIF